MKLSVDEQSSLENIYNGIEFALTEETYVKSTPVPFQRVLIQALIDFNNLGIRKSRRRINLRLMEMLNEDGELNFPKVRAMLSQESKLFDSNRHL